MDQNQKCLILNCKPFKTYEDFLLWSQDMERDCFIKCQTKLENSLFRTDNNRRRMLFCHDLKGGYLPDDECQIGCDNMEGYRFWRWQQVDIFVYFSHNFITIPPAGWIEACHKNGVQVLGTLITEWDDGVFLCSKFLENDNVIDCFIEKLVEITKYFSFDGWLLNIENKLEPEQVEKMLMFVEKLTKTLNTEIQNSLVIWYDSVTVDGELLWQNELNDKNLPFFERCNGIFLNYTWTPENLDRTSDVAAQMLRKYDVFVGVDVFGRGCVGRFDSCSSVKEASCRHLSSAIFAPSWTFEGMEKDVSLKGTNFIDNENKFWDALKFHSSHRDVVSLPFKTTFCQGCGQKYFWNGQELTSKKWTNLSCQSIGPIFEDPSFTYSYEDSFCGGSCLKFVCSEYSGAKLFNFDYDFEEDLHIKFTHKLTRNNAAVVSIMLLLKIHMAVDDCGETEKEKLKKFRRISLNNYQYFFSTLEPSKLNDSNDSHFENFSVHNTNENTSLSHNNWRISHHKLQTLTKMTLQAVHVYVEPTVKGTETELLIGGLEIFTSSKENEINSRYDARSQVLKLTLSNKSEIIFSNVDEVNFDDTFHSFTLMTFVDSSQDLLRPLEKLLSDELQIQNVFSEKLYNAEKNKKIVENHSFEILNLPSSVNIKLKNNSNLLIGEDNEKKVDKIVSSTPLFLSWKIKDGIKFKLYHVFVKNESNEEWMLMAHTPTNICKWNIAISSDQTKFIKIVGFV